MAKLFRRESVNARFFRGTRGSKSKVHLLQAVARMAIAATGCAAGTSVAYARDAAPEESSETVASKSGIEDIVVTARRRSESQQSVPVAITALSTEQLESKGILRASDLMNAVPGVFSGPATIRGSNAPTFMIRGMVNRDPALTSDPSIGIYFAEVPWARPDGSNAALIDLESVQVLKGPQGTLFGRNSTAGAILLTPKAPSDKFEGYGKLSLGDYGLFGAEAVLNVPLGDTLAVRFALSHEERDGYLRNVSSGIHTNDLDNYSARGSIRWAPTESFSTTLIGSYYKSNTTADGFKFLKVSPAPPSAGVAGLYPKLVAGLARSKLLGKYQFYSSLSPSFFATPINGVPGGLTPDPYSRIKVRSIQDATTIDLGDSPLLGEMTLKNIASYRTLKSDFSSEAIAIDVLTSTQLSSVRERQFTNELQLQGKSGGLDYVAGLFYFRETGNDFTNNYSIVPISNITDNKVVNTSYSAFASLSYNLSSWGLDGLGITAGLRFNHDRRYLLNKNRRQTTPGQIANPMYICLVQPTVPVNDGSLCHLAQSVSFNEPTWNVGLNYQASPGSLLYATVSHGYRTGGFNLFANNAAAIEPFSPEKVYNYELGSKNDFDLGGLAVRLNVAGYYIKYKDIQRSLGFINSNNVLTGSVFNAAAAHIWGAETELTFKPSRYLEATLGYAYTRPKYDQFNEAFREPSNGVIYNVDISKSEFTLVSRHSFNASVNYSLPVEETYGRPSISATYYYRSSFYTGNDINPPGCTIPGDPNPAAIYANCYNRGSKLPGYGLVNVRADWREVMGSNFDLALFVNNLTNKYYFNQGTTTLSSLGGFIGFVGPPRMFGGSVTFRFGGR